MAKLFRKGKVQKIVAIVLGLVTVAGAVFGVSALAKYAKEEQKTIHPTFSVGGLTKAGVYEETADTIYTKDSFEAKGLQIKLDFDSNVKYQVFFYDELDKFISCTEVYTESQDFSVPLNARVRLEVTPIEGADAPVDKEIKWYETVKYASQLEVRVDKIQYLVISDFKCYEFTDTKMFTVEENTYYESGIAKENTVYDTYSLIIKDDYTCMFLINDGEAFVQGNIKLDHTAADGSLKHEYYYDELNELSIDNLISLEKGDVLRFSFEKTQVNVDDLSCLIYLG